MLDSPGWLIGNFLINVEARVGGRLWGRQFLVLLKIFSVCELEINFALN